MKKLLVLACLATLCATAQAQQDYKRRFNTNANVPDDTPWEESSYDMPAFPGNDGFIGLDVPLAAGYRYQLEEKSLSITPDGVLHYVLKVTSPKGAENISVEGLHCARKHVRSYAFGDTVNKRWILSMNSQWRDWNPFDKVKVTLRDTVCDIGVPPRDAEDFAMRLKKAAPRQ